MPAPKAHLDLKQIEAAASIGCTREEIAVLLGVHAKTIQRRAEANEAIATGQAKMRSSLRRMQWAKAKEGNVAMLIWLGKQILGQKDRVEETHREEVVEIERIAPKPKVD